MSSQGSLKDGLLHLRGSGIVEKPADEGDPQAATEITPQHLQYPNKNEEESEESANRCRQE